MLNRQKELRVSYDIGCMRSLKKLPDRVSTGFLEMMSKVMTNPSLLSLNIETITGACDSKIKSVRINQAYRAIGYFSDPDFLFLHVNEHDKAYRWANNRTVRIDRRTQRIRIVELVPTETVEASPSEPSASQSDYHQPGIFEDFSDQELIDLGLMAEEMANVRAIVNESGLEGCRETLDPHSYNILYALASGYSAAEIPALFNSSAETSGNLDQFKRLDLGPALEADVSRQSIFTPKNEDELRKFINGDLEGWRIYLHPDQRQFAYRDYNGPAMVRGGAGTGKTVVAMHRAKYLADKLIGSKKVLFTTFTTSLAKDIENNLKSLCPEHLEGKDRKIEVKNLDAWVSEFLRNHSYDRKIAYFAEQKKQLEDIWCEVFDEFKVPDGLSETFIKSEWTQIIQAKGISTAKEYSKVPRTGRGTPLNRKMRAELWKAFELYRARLLDTGLAEIDDAYREAISILQNSTISLPYSTVIVDEGQDMGEQAFRLIRAIASTQNKDDCNSIFVVGDAHQRIYPRKTSMSSCGINVRGRSRKLRLNYRTTEHIRKWAVSVLEGMKIDDLDEGLDTLEGYTSLVKGEMPQFYSYDNAADEVSCLADWLESEIKNGAKASEIGIIARHKKTLQTVQQHLDARGLEYFRLENTKRDDATIPGVRLTTMHRAKGLEFQSVAIIGLTNSEFPPQYVIRQAVDEADKREIIEREKSLLHVAATRAKTSLRISWYGNRSDLFSDA